jgi:hypothetical protein
MMQIQAAGTTTGFLETAVAVSFTLYDFLVVFWLVIF